MSSATETMDIAVTVLSGLPGLAFGYFYSNVVLQQQGLPTKAKEKSCLQDKSPVGKL